MGNLEIGARYREQGAESEFLFSRVLDSSWSVNQLLWALFFKLSFV